MRKLFVWLRAKNVNLWDTGNEAFGKNYNWNMALVCSCSIIVWFVGVVPALIGGYVVDWVWLSAPMIGVPFAIFGVRKSRSKHLFPRFVEAVERIAAALEKMSETSDESSQKKQ